MLSSVQALFFQLELGKKSLRSPLFWIRPHPPKILEIPSLTETGNVTLWSDQRPVSPGMPLESSASASDSQASAQRHDAVSCSPAPAVFCLRARASQAQPESFTPRDENVFKIHTASCQYLLAPSSACNDTQADSLLLSVKIQLPPSSLCSQSPWVQAPGISRLPPSRGTRT